MPTLYTGIIRRPLITEKAHGRERDSRTRWSLRWISKATKTEVKQAVETLFKVKVAEASALQRSEGKERRRSKFGGYRRRTGRRPYVRLKEGQKMPEYLDSL